MTDLRSALSLQHHLSDAGGDRLSRAVVPDQLGVLVRSLEYVHRRLGVITHGVHEDDWQEAHQRQTHLRETDTQVIGCYTQLKTLETAALLPWVPPACPRSSWRRARPSASAPEDGWSYRTDPAGRSEHLRHRTEDCHETDDLL